MKTTIKIPRRKDQKLNEIIPYLRSTLGEFEGRRYAGPGWEFQIKEWKDSYPVMHYYDSDTAPAHYLLDVQDPARATLIALKFS